jgi:hypothetical protein
LVLIKELYYDARPTKSQDLHYKTSKTDIPLQEDQNKIVQKPMQQSGTIKHAG